MFKYDPNLTLFLYDVSFTKNNGGRGWDLSLVINTFLQSSWTLLQYSWEEICIKQNIFAKSS